jgi:transcription antitermination factor NusG
MLSNSNGNFWFALHVKSRMEQTAGELLRTKGYETLVPTYKPAESGSSVRMPLFPSYLFCRFDPNIRCPILTTPGVIRVVGYGKSPAVVCDAEIEAVRRIVLSPLEAKPHEYLHAGQVVIVKLGPLRGVVGKVVRLRNATHLIVSVSLLQRSISVEINSRWVDPVQNPAVKPIGQESDFAAVPGETKPHRPATFVIPAANSRLMGAANGDIAPIGHQVPGRRADRSERRSWRQPARTISPMPVGETCPDGRLIGLGTIELQLQTSAAQSSDLLHRYNLVTQGEPA